MYGRLVALFSHLLLDHESERREREGEIAARDKAAVSL